jgi:hypothetical protein
MFLTLLLAILFTHPVKIASWPLYVSSSTRWKTHKSFLLLARSSFKLAREKGWITLQEETAFDVHHDLSDGASVTES